MMIRLVLAALMLAAPAQAAQDGFVSVNGLRLHYVDWGGRGPTLLFLTGGGNGSAHTFDSFAPRFADPQRISNRLDVLGERASVVP
jgi:hypothetical protein